jgi:hypothetical protein
VQEVGAADDADQLSVEDNWDVLDAPRFHEGDDLGKGRVRRNRDDPLGHDLAHLAAMRANIFAGQAARRHQELDEPGMGSLGSDLGASQQIAFGDDADELSRGAQHGQAADAIASHQTGNVLDPRIRGRRHHRMRHHLSCVHFCLRFRLSKP